MTTDHQRRIVLVEDERALLENYRLALQKAGFVVDAFHAAAPALDSVAGRLPDLAIIDIGLGNDSEAGFALCQALRALSNRLPIIFLTARDSELDMISGLRLGADDYLSKEISLAQLVTRVNTLFRRIDALSEPVVANHESRLGALLMDTGRLQASWNSVPVELTVTEFALVASLVRYPGQVRSRQQLMEAASVVLDEQTITAHVKRIRRKFERLDTDFDRIQTVYGLGYRWVEPAREG